MSDCIESDLAPNNAGYCYMVVGSRTDGTRKHVGVHVLACEDAHGPAPEGKTYALHSCDNKTCVNPEHLFWGTQSDNMQDAIAKGRAPQAKHGSPGMYSHHGCRCSECRLARSARRQERYRRKKLAALSGMA